MSLSLVYMYDIEGESLTYNYTDPEHGTLSLNGSIITYTPQSDFFGTDSFTYTVFDDNDTGIDNLYSNTARDRKNSPVEGSYTNKLLSNKSLSKEKVLEEINELIEAVDKNNNFIHEAADVFYHLIMYLEANNVKIEEVMEELNKRKK